MLRSRDGSVYVVVTLNISGCLLGLRDGAAWSGERLKLGPDVFERLLAEHLSAENSAGLGLRLHCGAVIHLAATREALIQVLLVHIEQVSKPLSLRSRD